MSLRCEHSSIGAHNQDEQFQVEDRIRVPESLSKLTALTHLAFRCSITEYDEDEHDEDDPFSSSAELGWLTQLQALQSLSAVIAASDFDIEFPAELSAMTNLTTLVIGLRDEKWYLDLRFDWLKLTALETLHLFGYVASKSAADLTSLGNLKVVRLGERGFGSFSADLVKLAYNIGLHRQDIELLIL